MSARPSQRRGSGRPRKAADPIPDDSDRVWIEERFQRRCRDPLSFKSESELRSHVSELLTEIHETDGTDELIKFVLWAGYDRAGLLALAWHARYRLADFGRLTSGPLEHMKPRGQA